MYTQCPQCNAIFQLSASQLKAAHGEVRCGQCLSVFNALNHLSEDVPHGQQIDTTAELAAETQTYQQWSADNPHPASTETEPPLPAAEQDDVFREVVAEVSNHPLPEAAIEQFEEFLDSGELPAAADIEHPTPADERHQSAAVAPVETFGATEAPPDNNARPPSDPESAKQPDITPAETAAPSAETEDLPASASPAVFAIDERGIANEPSSLGDIEDATADLDTRIPVDDDEFAELNAFLNEDEDARAEAVLGLAAKAEGQPIIIEDTDLPPFDAPQAGGTPATQAATQAKGEPPHTPVTDQTVEAPTTRPTEQGDNETAPAIPSLILDELQAAKAERLRPRNTPWVVGTLVLMLSLLLQVAYHSRDELARDPTLRPWLMRLCDLLHCQLSQPYDITQIEIIGRDVRSHPEAPNALIVSTTLINNANFVQPFPLLTMVFSDINGKPIAQRRFTPREYLDNRVDLEAGMIPDMPVRIDLELVDPGKAAVNYEFHAEVDPRRTRPLG